MTTNSDVPATGIHRINGLDGEVRLDVAGKLTIWNADELKEILRQSRSSAATTIIGFGEEETIDIAGVQLLIAACRTEQRRSGGYSVLADPPEGVARWLQRAGLAIRDGEVRPDDAE